MPRSQRRWSGPQVGPQQFVFEPAYQIEACGVGWFVISFRAVEDVAL